MNRASSEILQENDAAREDLLESIRNLTQAQFDYRPISDRWSVGEIVHHLVLTEKQVTGLCEKMLERARSKNLPSAKEDMPSQLRCLDVFEIEVPSVPAKGPASTAPTHGISHMELMSMMKESRKALGSTATDLCAFDLSDVRFPHPLAGKINMYQWLLCVGKHERRHTRQIEAVKQSLHNQAL